MRTLQNAREGLGVATVDSSGNIPKSQVLTWDDSHLMTLRDVHGLYKSSATPIPVSPGLQSSCSLPLCVQSHCCDSKVIGVKSRKSAAVVSCQP